MKKFLKIIVICFMFISICSSNIYSTSQNLNTVDKAKTKLALFVDWGYYYSKEPQEVIEKFKNAGIDTIYLSGWYRCEDYFKFAEKLILEAHKKNMKIYLWLEFPMVSEKFWNDYPQYREKNAIGKDAHVDWRYLMALENEECFKLAMSEVKKIYDLYDWDGINFAELYYESPFGIDEPEKFTPFNSVIASRYKEKYDKDITSFFDEKGNLKASESDINNLLEFRQVQLDDLTKKSILALKEILKKNNGGLVITQIDNNLDKKVSKNIGISDDYFQKISKLKPDQIIIEDPFTVWSLEADRYLKLSKIYKDLKLVQPLGIDINIVRRFDNDKFLEPQSGKELEKLLVQAKQGFDFVVLYWGHDISDEDLNNIREVMNSID